MVGWEGDLLVAERTTMTFLSVTVISFDVGSPLLSGRADEKAHSSSSAAGAADDVGIWT